MSHSGTLTFGDLIKKLSTLRVTCDKCGRKGRYSIRRLAAERGRDGQGHRLAQRDHLGLPAQADQITIWPTNAPHSARIWRGGPD